jgi:hypothetical protein
MFNFFRLFIKCLFLPFSYVERELLSLILLMRKENACLKRTLCLRKKRIKIDPFTKRIICFLHSLFPRLKKHITIVRPETVLTWTRNLIKHFWTFPHRLNAKGRPSTPQAVKNLILSMKNRNLLWGARRIQGELLKLGITLHKKTISNILKDFRKQRIIHFSEDKDTKSYLIHDRSPEFIQNYPLYNIKGVATSVRAPNMNAYAERFVSSVRREALDNFIIFNESQLRHILLQYIHYYNSRRPHQGIHQKIPDGYTPQTQGAIVSVPVLSGLHHHYTRVA